MAPAMEIKYFLLRMKTKPLIVNHWGGSRLCSCYNMAWAQATVASSALWG